MNTTGEKRFEFGKNWTAFLKVVDEQRILEAERSLLQMLGLSDLSGKTFLDIGSGSGLFSLAARRLGAKVHSFDYDKFSVACALELKKRYFPSDNDWKIEQGSILDAAYIKSLNQFDIVYSWGVLHHTGNMLEAFKNAETRVKEKGRLFLSIYNDQGIISRAWTVVKKIYCSGTIGKTLVITAYFPYFAFKKLVSDLLHGKNPVSSYSEYKLDRGMSVSHDWIDWLGGFPFEVAKPEEIFDFFHKKGYQLEKLKTCGGGMGCNELVFQKS